MEGGLQGLLARAHPPRRGSGTASAAGMVRPGPAACTATGPDAAITSGANPGPCSARGMLPLWHARALGQGLCQWWAGAGPFRRKFRRRLVPGGGSVP